MKMAVATIQPARHIRPDCGLLSQSCQEGAPSSSIRRRPVTAATLGKYQAECVNSRQWSGFSRSGLRTEICGATVQSRQRWQPAAGLQSETGRSNRGIATIASVRAMTHPLGP